MPQIDPIDDENVLKPLRSYAQTLLTLYKYKAIKTGGEALSGLLIDILKILCILITLVFANITLGLYLTNVFESAWKGAGALALIYMVLIVLLAALRNMLYNPIRNVLIRYLTKATVARPLVSEDILQEDVQLVNKVD